MSAPFRVIQAHWARDHERLRQVREEVFIHGQQVPVALEWDGLDPDCQHVLALDAAEAAIGTARLTPEGGIGRMAVRAPWRRRGVGAAMLRQLLEMAQAQGWPQVWLHAQVSAIGFYARFGFIAAGEEFMEAGIRHQLMHKALPPPTGHVYCSTRAATRQVTWQLLRRARHQVCLSSPDLMPALIDNDATLTQLRRLAESGRHALLRCLLQEPDSVLRLGHRLLPLAQRLPSFVQLRVLTEPADRARGEAFVFNDQADCLHQAQAGRPPAYGQWQAPGAQRQLQRHFDAMWERATVASSLRQLSL